MKKSVLILGWVLTAIFVIGGVSSPGLQTVFLLAAAVLVCPLFREKVKLPGKAWIPAVAVLFLVGVFLTPVEERPERPLDGDDSSKSANVEASSSPVETEPGQTPVVAPEPGVTREPESEPPTSQQETKPPAQVSEPSEPEEVTPTETTPEPDRVDLTLEPTIHSDWEIITREGHPTFYGSVEHSHLIWDDVEKGKIVFPDGYDKWGDSTILSMEAYRNSDLIREIYVSLVNFDVPTEKTLDEILPVVASYMPYEVMDKYYEFRRSYSIEPDEGKEDTDNYFVVSYGLTDEGKTAYYEKEHEYSGSIDVIICTNENGQVKNFDIRFGTPRWMSSLSTNSRHKVDWSCDLYDYR